MSKQSAVAAEATRLQRTLFSRWCNQKLALSRNIAVEDIVKAVADGTVLVALLEVLSEKKCPHKLVAAPKSRVQQVENCNNALKFVWECGVEMKLKPQGTDLVDGIENNVLGLIWAVMLRFLKFGDDSDSLNAKDALLLWVKNKVASYKGLTVSGFGKEWHNGLLLCAIIHKHRPRLVNFDSLSAGNGLDNIRTAQEAALKYFNLEKYLTAEDILKLDENSMVVYVSEYFFGIAESRKIDLAARRIQKLITLTKENDAAKAFYNSTAAGLTTDIKGVEKLLGDRTIDNNMAGAKKRIADFYHYKETMKNTLIGRQLELEGTYNNLAMRLSHNKRPAFQPPPELSLKGIAKTITELEAAEQERKVALHAELNRQIKLVRTDEAHQRRTDKTKAWGAQKAEYLAFREEIDSVSGAQLQLRLLDASDKEAEAVHHGVVGDLKNGLTDYLRKEIYENLANVEARDEELEILFAALAEASKVKRPVLDDHLAREEFKVKVRLQVKQHIGNFDKLKSWIGEKTAYLKKKEEISSVDEAQIALSLLALYHSERGSTYETNVTALKKLGEAIVASVWKTTYSGWKFEHPEELTQRESNIDGDFGTLDELHAEKQKVLQDDLDRELFKAKLRLWNTTHQDKFAKLQTWVAEKKAYLQKKETITSISDARTALALLDAYGDEKKSTHDTLVKQLKAQGQEIIDAKYNTNYSSAHWETPKEITDRHDAIDAAWEELSTLSAAKQSVLDDDLARENFKQDLRMQNRSHIDQHDRLQAWVAEQEAYLNKKESINSISEAQEQISLLETYERAKDMLAATSVDALNKLGVKISTAEFKGTHSEARWESNDELKAREDAIAAKWTHLSTLSAAKLQVLKEDLAREQEKERLRLEFAHVAADFVRWTKEEADRAAETSFGFTLEEVEAYKATLDKSEAARTSAAAEKLAAAGAVQDQLNALAVTDNNYTKLSLADLNGALGVLKQAEADCQTAYAKELARQQENDRKCKAFAEVSEAFAKLLTETKDKITNSNAELKDQLAVVNEKLGALEATNKTAEIDKLQAIVDEAGVTNNRHTTLTATDVRVLWKQYGEFLTKKKTMLEETIESLRLRGLTAEQLKEIEDSFKQFDENGDGTIDSKELKACLYSLGEERSQSQIKAIVEEFGSNGVIPYNGFREFMIRLLGDSDTKEEIVQGFKLINRGDLGKWDKTSDVMQDAYVQYLKENAEKVGDDGFNYVSWTESVYAR